MNVLTLLFSLATVLTFQAQSPVYEVTALTTDAPNIDGRLTEAAWTDPSWADDFLSLRGESPRMRTSFSIQSDEQFLYVGVRLDDPEPDQIAQVEGERDDVNGDRIALFLDTNGDGETSFVFVINAAGTVRDQLGEANNGPWDNGWDSEWSAASTLGEDGWRAEFRIPFATLGVTPSAGDEWGLQLTRAVARLEAPIVWRPVSQSVGWTASFGRMVFSQ